MKICIVGLGSIGRRHARNVRYLFNQDVPLQIDAFRSRNAPLPAETADLISKQYFTHEEVPDDYDVIIVSNPTNLHYDTVCRFAAKTKHFFIEKPVFDHANYDPSLLPPKEDCVYYVACPLRYSRVLAYLKEYVQNRRVYGARAICSTYLPDWRPDEDYRTNYSALAEQGGGVRRDLIHEWDYLTWLFGEPVEVCGMHGNVSRLKISSEDVALYIARFPQMFVSLHLDYFGRAPQRYIELYTQDEVVIGDVYNQKVRFLHSGKEISLPQERDEMQRLEMQTFFKAINKELENPNPLSTAIKTLQIALGEKKI